MLAGTMSQNLPLDEIERALDSRGEELDSLLRKAGDRRDQRLKHVGREGIITYSRKVFVPVTTLCRDRCHYCTFVDTPAQAARKGTPLFMTPERVLAVAAQGARLGCKEVLFTLGDRPEDRWPEAKEWLASRGYASTIDYLRYLGQLVLDETGLLPHMNPGVMTADELQLLRPVAPSMGMMLETTSRDLWLTPGRAHHGSPDKDPAVRLRVLEDAGRAGIPFTTGLLIGIGETVRDRAESLRALAEMSTRFGHIQEVIIQNFRAKSSTAMRGVPDADWDGYLATVAVARLVLGLDVSLQAPPNLADDIGVDALLAAGVDDWGGVSPLTADHVNPERPWPEIDALASRTDAGGYTLRERLTAHPRYVKDAARWFAPEVRGRVADLADAESGLACKSSIRPSPRRSTGWFAHTDPTRQALSRIEQDPATATDADYTGLLLAGDDDLRTLCRLADDVRRYTVGEYVTFVRNRSIGIADYSGAERARAESLTDADVRRIVQDADADGLTEVCFQGLATPAAGSDAYRQLIAAARSGSNRVHIHAFRAAELIDGARRAGLPMDPFLDSLKDAGVGTVTGTGVTTFGAAPSSAPNLDHATWSRTIVAAHHAGLRSTSVIIYGAGESASQRIAHLRALAHIQDTTDGFTEIIPMPTASGFSPLRRGRTADAEHTAMTAVSRLLLHGRIRHVQAAWTRLGDEGAAGALRSGADDLGGTLDAGGVRPDVSVLGGASRTPAQLAEIARRAGRGLRERSTLYGRLQPAGAEHA